MIILIHQNTGGDQPSLCHDWRSGEASDGGGGDGGQASYILLLHYQVHDEDGDDDGEVENGEGGVDYDVNEKFLK